MLITGREGGDRRGKGLEMEKYKRGVDERRGQSESKDDGKRY